MSVDAKSIIAAYLTGAGLANDLEANGFATDIAAALADVGLLTRYDRRPFVAFDPAMRCGEATLNHTRLPVEAVAGYMWAGEGLAHVMDAYEITRADVITACWWMGRHGPRKWRNRWGQWAQDVEGELWHTRFEVPEPPADHEVTEGPQS